MAKRKNPLLTLPCQFGNVSIGDETCRVGLKVERPTLDLDTAEEFFCGKRLTGAISNDNGNPDQRVIGEMEDDNIAVNGIFDVKGFSVKRKSISFGLTFVLGSINAGDLAKLAKRGGRFTVKSADELPDGAESEED